MTTTITTRAEQGVEFYLSKTTLDVEHLLNILCLANGLVDDRHHHSQALVSCLKILEILVTLLRKLEHFLMTTQQNGIRRKEKRKGGKEEKQSGPG